MLPSGSMCFVEDPTREKWLLICSTSSPVVAPAPLCHLPPHKTWNLKELGNIFTILSEKYNLISYNVS